MIDICPTVTAYDIENYKQQLELVSSLAKRIHIDVMDESFVPKNSPLFHEMWWQKSTHADIHIMHRFPQQLLHDVLHKRPSLTIVHHEAEHVSSFVHELHEQRLRVGVALLPDTSVEVLSHYANVVDHVLVFGGTLGSHGGVADLRLLHKVQYIAKHYPHLEIGWDGGANDTNIQDIVQAGVTVVNVGSYIHKNSEPQEAYQKLEHLLKS